MKLIKLNPDHYVVVDDSEIKKGDWIYNAEREPSILECVGKGSLRGWQKITHSTQPIDCACSNRGYKLDTNCAERNRCFDKVQYLPLQEVKALIGEVDIWQKFKEIDGSCQKGEYEHWLFESGYNQALEDNKEKKYTEEDLRKIFYVGVQLGINQELYTQLGKPLQNEEEVLDRTIKSLQPKTEWEVEFVDGKLKLK